MGLVYHLRPVRRRLDNRRLFPLGHRLQHSEGLRRHRLFGGRLDTGSCLGEVGNEGVVQPQRLENRRRLGARIVTPRGPRVGVTIEETLLRLLGVRGFRDRRRRRLEDLVRRSVVLAAACRRCIGADLGGQPRQLVRQRLAQWIEPGRTLQALQCEGAVAELPVDTGQLAIAGRVVRVQAQAAVESRARLLPHLLLLVTLPEDEIAGRVARETLASLLAKNLGAQQPAFAQVLIGKAGKQRSARVAAEGFFKLGGAVEHRATLTARRQWVSLHRKHLNSNRLSQTKVAVKHRPCPPFCQAIRVPENVADVKQKQTLVRVCVDLRG